MRTQDLLSEYRQRAAGTLPQEVLDYIDGGAGDEITLEAAEGSWTRLRLRPRVLTDVSEVDTTARLFGTCLDVPVLLGPVASHELAHPDGELASAAAAARASSVLVVSTRASKRLEDIAARVPGRWWLQVYLTRERAVTAGLVRRAVAAGATAIVLTGDVPVLGPKRRQGRPAALSSPTALVNLGEHLPPGADPVHALEQDPAATERDIGWLRGLSGLPVLVKGVLSGADAQRCLDAGAAGVIVSNHGGRQLDRAAATADVLAEVVDTVGARAPVLVDGGIRGGLDCLAALALGARSVLIGKPMLWALASGGADAVYELLVTMRQDLATCMALAGCASVPAITSDLIAPSG